MNGLNLARRKHSSHRATYLEIGRLIAARRRLANKSEEEVAAGAGMHVETYRKMEQGSPMGIVIHRLCALAEYFKCGLDELVPRRVSSRLRANLDTIAEHMRSLSDAEQDEITGLVGMGVALIRASGNASRDAPVHGQPVAD